MTQHRQLWWLRSACFFQIFAFGVAWPFEGVWMRDQGLGEAAIGAIASLSTAALLLAGLGWGVVADRTGRPDRIVLAGCLGVALSLAAIPFCQNASHFALYGIGRGLAMPMVGNLMPLLAVSALGPAARGRGYALYRVFGSVGYIVSTLLLPRLLGVRDLFWAAAAAMLTACLPLSRIRNRFVPRRQGGSLRELLRDGDLVGFLVAGFFFSLAGPACFTFTAVYARQLGADQVFIGFLAASQGIIAVVALPLTGMAVDRFGVRALLWLGFLAQPVRALGQAAVTDYHWLLLPQLCHFFTWAGFEVAGVLLVTQLADEESQGAAQSLFRGCQVLGMLVGAGLSGYLAEYHGYPVMFVLAAAAAAVGLVLFTAMLWRSHSGRMESGPGATAGVKGPTE